MWFTEADETSVVESVEKIAENQHENAEKLVRIKPCFVVSLFEIRLIVCRETYVVLL